MTTKLLLLCGALALTLAGCAPGPDPTVFEAPIGLSPATTASMRLNTLQVNVPGSLTVSTNPNEQFPKTDIVWYEEPAGDRRAQVRQIVEGAIGSAFAPGGSVPVNVQVNVRTFHALTPKALAGTLPAWHDIKLDIVLRGADGAILAQIAGLNADIAAPTSTEAKRILATGETQARRIHSRIVQAVRLWLKSGT